MPLDALDADGGDQKSHGVAAEDLPAYAEQIGQRARRQAQMLAALVSVQRDFLVGGAAHDVFERMLGHLVELTGSEYGFIGETQTDADGKPFLRMHGLSDLSWNAQTRATFERVRAGGFEFRNMDTLFGEVVRTAAPVVVHHPALDPRRGGLPEGHPPLNCFLGLPLTQGSQLIGIVGLANAPGGYDSGLAEDLAPMLATCSSMILALHLEQERKRAEIALDALAARYTMLSGAPFYEAVCKHFAEALQIDQAFVGELSAAGDSVAVRAGWADGKPMGAFKYALLNTPCERVIGREPCVFPRDVARHFPEDHILAEGGYAAYCATPLSDKEGGALGLLVGLSRQPLADEAAARELLEIFDGPVSAELIRERAEAALNRRIEFERLVARISSELMPARPEEVGGLLTRALEHIGPFADADRVFVFEVSDDGQLLDNTYEWCREGVSPQRDKLQGVPFDDVMLFCRLIKRHEIVDFPDVCALPAGAEVDREVLSAQSIRSTLAAPMVANGQLLGFVGLDSVRAARQWSDEEKTLMRLTGNAFASVLERKRSDDTLRESEARYRSVVESVKEVIFQVDMDGRWIFLNRAWADLTGHAVEETLGRAYVDYVHPDDRELHQELFDMLRRRDALSCTQALRYQRIGGGSRWVEFNARPLFDASAALLGFTGTLNDITLQKEHEAQLEYIAHYDALTGLPNRVLLHDRLSRSMVQSRRRGQHLAVAYIDLDGFKAVNDTHGHHVGDQLLTTVAARMKGALREGDSVSRLGGDEFVAVLVDLPDVQACKQLTHRLLTAVAQSVWVAGLELHVSASIGLTLYPQREEVDADQLLRQADLAMYQAKLAGKNRYHFFDTDHDRSLRGRHEGLTRMRKGMRAGEFALLYQPKVNMRSGAVTGVEALIRWQHPELGLIEPAAFLPVVDDQPLATELGDWVIGQALAQAAAWKRDGLALPVSVNIAARHLQSADFMVRLQAALSRYPELAPGCLELEVLESSALESMTRVTQIVEACAEIGVSFALDDFGTGYSALAYLKRLPAARLKIDQLFVREMLDDPEDLAILEAILGLARAFRREVVAEGVESEAHGRILLQLGCEVAQGYGIARPMAPDAIPGWVASWSPPASWRGQVAVSREFIPLIYAQVEHRALVRKLAVHLADGTPLPVQTGMHACSLGDWVGSLAEMGADGAQLELVCRDHTRLHEAIDGLVASHRASDAARVIMQMGCVRERLDALLGGLHKLLEAR